MNKTPKDEASESYADVQEFLAGKSTKVEAEVEQIVKETIPEYIEYLADVHKTPTTSDRVVEVALKRIFRNPKFVAWREKRAKEKAKIEKATDEDIDASLNSIKVNGSNKQNATPVTA